MAITEIDHNINPKIELVIGELTLPAGNKLRIANAYIPPGGAYKDITVEDLKALLVTGDIVVGDFNAKSPLWDDDRVDADEAGTKLEKAIDETQRCILNTGEPTHMIAQGTTDRMNTLDIAIADVTIANKATWEVNSDNLGSDHFPILITTGGYSKTKDSENLIPNRINTTKTDWTKFHEHTELKTIWDKTANVETKTTRITERIIQAVKDNTPNRTGTTRPGRTWWNKNCDSKIKDRKRKLKIWKKHQTVENRIEYRRAKAIAVQAVKEAKKEDWQKFTESLDLHSKVKESWDKIKALNNGPRHTMPTLKVGDQNYATDLEKAELLAETFSKASSDNNLTPEFRELKPCISKCFEEPEWKDNYELDDNISILELATALRSVGKGKAPGRDLISYEMVRKCHPTMKQAIVDLFNDIYAQGEFPDLWKTAIVFPLHKTGKPTNQPNSYRPIALTSQLGKTLERILKNRLMDYCEKHQILPPQQSGFRKKRSTLDHLTTLQQEILNTHKERRTELIGIFLDIEKAYDMLWHEKLLSRMGDLGISNKMYNLVKSFLADRRLIVRVGSKTSREHKLENGVPQGSVLSPLLFLIMLSGLQHVVRHTKIMNFADDTSLIGKVQTKYRGSKANLEGFEEFQQDLTRVINWLTRAGFKISNAKTQAIIFRTNKKKKYQVVNEIPKLKVNGDEIEYKKQITFLGVIFTHNNNWAPYINKITQAARIGINLMRKVSGADWGADPKSLLNLYHAYVMSRLLYAAPLLTNLNKTLSSKLQTIQASALKIVLGVPSHTPNLLTLAESGQKPVDIIIKQRAAKYFYKVISMDENHPAKHTLTQPVKPPLEAKQEPQIKTVVAELEKTIGLTLTDKTPKINQDIPRWKLPQIEVDLDLTKYNKETDSHQIKAEFYEKCSTTYQNHAVIYTDGSHDPNTHETGLGIHIPSKTDRAIKLPNHTSVFAAELTAILGAIKAIQTDLKDEKNVLIAVDSLSAIQAIQGADSVREDLTILIRSRVGQLAEKGQNIKLIWIPSHIGIKGNEIADTLAKDGLNKTQIILKQAPLSALERYNALKPAFQKTWEENFKQRARGRRKGLTRTLDPKTKLYKGKRSDQARIARLRLGGERYLVQKANNPCPCGHPISTDHILLDCPLLNESRARITDQIKEKPTIDNLLNPPPEHWQQILTLTLNMVNNYPLKDKI